METREAQSIGLGNTNSLANQVRLVPDNVINKNIRPLSMHQRKGFNFVQKWSRDYMKSLGCKIRLSIKSFCTFITGGAGVGKSHLIKSIHMSLIYSGLGINFGSRLYPLSNRQHVALKNKLSEVRLIIIDVVSMVSSALIFQLNQRLNEIF